MSVFITVVQSNTSYWDLSKTNKTVCWSDLMCVILWAKFCWGTLKLRFQVDTSLPWTIYQNIAADQVKPFMVMIRINESRIIFTLSHSKHVRNDLRNTKKSSRWSCGILERSYQFWQHGGGLHNIRQSDFKVIADLCMCSKDNWIRETLWKNVNSKPKSFIKM